MLWACTAAQQPHLKSSRSIPKRVNSCPEPDHGTNNVIDKQQLNLFKQQLLALQKTLLEDNELGDESKAIETLD